MSDSNHVETTAMKAEIADLRSRLEDAEEALRAISKGEVDALVANVSGVPQLFVLQSSDVESNRFHSEILAKVNDAVIAFDEEQFVTYMNVAAEAQYGVTASEALGKHVDSLFESLWHDPADEGDALEMMRTTGVWQGESLHVRKDGVKIYVEASASRITDPDGSPAGYLHVIRDITVRRLAEEQRRHNEILFSTIIDQAPGGVYVADDQLATVQVSQRARPLFASAEPLMGRNVAEVMTVLWGKEAGDEITSFFRHTLATGERCVSKRFTETRADLGIVQSYEWVTQRLTLPSGTHGVVCYFTDVTEQQALENTLRAHAEELAVADRRKDEFLAMLAHELRNPLAPMLPGVEVLLMSPSDPEIVARIGNMLRRQVDQMSRLIDDLLDMSRITTGKIELKKSRVALSDILGRAVEAVQPLIDKFGHALTIENGREGVTLDVDPHRLAQVVSNLLSNAAKYTPPNGRIHLSSGNNGNGGLQISVRDNGKGIKPSYQATIFDLFDQGSSGPADGLGIGLTLVRSLVEMHGGSVRVKSDGEGKGSEFVVELPLSSQGEMTDAQEAPVDAAGDISSKLRVLVADDGKTTADVLAMFFQMEGMETAVAYDGLQAVDRAAEFMPQLICMDLGMPGLDGFEAARKIRSTNREVYLVALSGWGSDKDRKRSAEAGFNEHLTKPVKPGDLRELVARLFAAR